MQKAVHKSETRGVVEYGWLKSRHTFSFAGYHNPERMGFGALRVINDDWVEPSRGFDTHRHKNMEIVSIPLQGSLRHEDNRGNQHVIHHGEIQIMSAGTGIAHSEYNNSDSAKVNFLQIWILPKEQNIEPHYDQKAFPVEERKNRFQLAVGPEPESEALWINQDAYFSLGSFEQGQKAQYRLNVTGNGLYLLVIEGAVGVAGEDLCKRDGIALVDVAKVDMEIKQTSELLVIEVPTLIAHY